MASFSVRGGVPDPSTLGSTDDVALIIAGQKQHLQTLTSHCNVFVSPVTWKEAVKRLPERGELPLLFNQAKVLVIPSVASRHNCAANPHALGDMLKWTNMQGGTERLLIVLHCEKAHALPLVSAVSRVYPLYNRKTEAVSSLKEVIVYVDCIDDPIDADDVTTLTVLARNIRLACTLVDTPSNEMTTNRLVAEAVEVAEKLKAGCLVIQGEELREQGFGGIYHVGKAGPTPPAFVVLSHEPQGASKTFALVGKGVVFDTGGHSMKTKTQMPTWKCDMAGAAGVLAAFSSLVSAGFTQNLHACLCIVENSVAPAANKPDDVITLLSGKTVEINNTDAEGRLILADGVYYAKEALKADVIIDLATLTTLQGVMTGSYHSAVMSSSAEYEGKAVAAGLKSGDLTHPMVFAPELHFSDFTSPVADARNSQLGSMKGPASSIAGLFIGWQLGYGSSCTWMHIDMGTLALDSRGRATGYGVALLSTLLGEHTASAILH